MPKCVFFVILSRFPATHQFDLRQIQHIGVGISQPDGFTNNRSTFL
jgi:hypothetical protein